MRALILPSSLLIRRVKFGIPLDEAYWSTPPPSTPSSGGYAPTARIGFAMSSNQLEVGSQVLIFGGKSMKEKTEGSN